MRIVVYTYGRYGDLKKDKSITEGTNLIGEGVLIKLTGNDAKDYISDQMLNKDAIVFEFQDASDKQVMTYFEDRWKRSDKVPTKEKGYVNSKTAKVVDEYNLFKNNCVTTSVSGMQRGLKQDINIKSIIPYDLKIVLDRREKIDEYNIRKISYDEIKKELELPNGATSRW